MATLQEFGDNLGYETTLNAATELKVNLDPNDRSNRRTNAALRASLVSKNVLFNENFKPEDLTTILKAKKGTHEKIFEFIKDNKLNLQSHEWEECSVLETTVKARYTLMQRLLREAGNGCGIVEEVLSSYISYIGEDLDSNDFCAKLNFLGITNPGKESLKSQASASEKNLFENTVNYSDGSLVDDLLFEINKYSESALSIVKQAFRIAYIQSCSDSKEIDEVEGRHTKYEACRGKCVRVDIFITCYIHSFEIFQALSF